MRMIQPIPEPGLPPQRWQILLLTCREPATDFRLALAQELQALGHNVAYALLKRRPVVTELALPNSPRTFSVLSFFYYLRAELEKYSHIVVLNSTNIAFPILSIMLKKICGGLWCFDMHDDLLYGSTGYARTKAAMAQRLLLRGSDFIIHAAPTLKELFPQSHHLGNASSMTAIPRSTLDFRRILILASLDARLDFEFLSAAAAANSGLAFHIHGKISQNDQIIARRIETLIRRNPNVNYHGPYINDDLPRILGAYAVTLAPYVTGAPLTRYIDPLRYYHCLNSGMEVISTDIPKARDLRNALHIVGAPAEIGPLIERLRQAPEARRNSGSTALDYNWRNRALAFLNIAAAFREAQEKGSVR